MTRFPTRLASAGLAAALLLGASSQAALAQSTGPAPVLNVGSSEYAISRKLDLSIGRSLVVELPRDAKEVFVANPKVANAVVRTARKLFVIGIADGATSMFVMDGEGRQITALEINVGRDLNVLRQTLRTALPNSQIEIKPAGDSILLIGSVPNASEATQAVDIANAFVGVSEKSDKKGAVINSLTIRDRDQVMVKVVVSEVQRKAIKQLGINSTGEWKLGKFSVTPSIDNPLPLQPQALSATAITAGLGNAQNFTLRALERAGLARVLAEPTVTAISGETAKFTAGGEVPIPKGQNCSYDTFNRRTCSIQIDYKPIGVTLNFTPIVLSDNKISMRIATEVTELDFENQLRLSGSEDAGLNMPAFRVRKSDTTVELPSGGSIVIAGLVRDDIRQAVSGFPGLSKIPVFGTLFRSRDFVRNETEMVIIATPYLVRPVARNQLAKPDDNFSPENDAAGFFLNRVNKVYGRREGQMPSGEYHGAVGFIYK